MQRSKLRAARRIDKGKGMVSLRCLLAHIAHLGLYMEAFRVQQRLPANLTDDITNHAGQPPLSAVSQRPIFILARSIVIE